MYTPHISLNTYQTSQRRQTPTWREKILGRSWLANYITLQANPLTPSARQNNAIAFIANAGVPYQAISTPSLPMKKDGLGYEAGNNPKHEFTRNVILNQYLSISSSTKEPELALKH